MEETLQHKTPSQCSGLPTASAGNHHPDGTQANDALTINLDQSDQAAQPTKVLSELEGLKGEVIETSLSVSDEKELRAALSKG